MPTSSPHLSSLSPKARRPICALGRWLVALVTLAGLAGAVAIASARAQTLARPGWTNSGPNTEQWWQHAVFYVIGSPASPAGESRAANSEPDFKAVAAKLDALRALGVDALLLPAPRLPVQMQPQAQSGTGSAPAAAAASDPAGLDTLDDFDELIHQASRAGIRVLLTIPAPSATVDRSGPELSVPELFAPELFATARFWLSRGVAGFYVVTPQGGSSQDSQAIVQALRKVTASVAGQRIVISDFDPNSAAGASAPQPAKQGQQSTRRAGASRTQRSPDLAAQLQIDSQPSRVAVPDAAHLRPLLAEAFAQRNLVLAFHPPATPASAPDPFPALAGVRAVIQLTTRPAALIDADEALVLKPATDKPATDAAAEPAPPAPPPAAANSGSTFTLVLPPVAPPPSPAPKPPTPQMLTALALTDWYRQLAVLHHGNAALRVGNATVLDFDQQNALVWLTRATSNSPLTPPVVVLCNLSPSPVKLALGAAIKGLNLRGTYLRTLLRSDKAMGPQDIDGVVLSPYSVYIGELRR